MICDSCGANIPDGAKFCPKCGKATVNKVVQPQPQPEAAVQQPKTVEPNLEAAVTPQPTASAAPTPAAQPSVQKSGNSAMAFSWISKHFWGLFVAMGALAYLLMEISSLYVQVSATFSIVLGVFAIIFACAFAAVGILNKVASVYGDQKDKGAHTTRDNVCLIVSLILFVIVLLGSIAIFNICSDILESENSLSSIF